MLTLCCLLSVVAYVLLKWVVYNFWIRKGFPHIQPDIPFGNLGPVVFQKRSFGFHIQALYKQTTEPLVGIYLFFRPALLIRDKELIKRILVSDFKYFYDRGTYYNEKNDPIGSNLFGMTGKQWSCLRAKLTPVFTGNKIKFMFNQAVCETVRLQDNMAAQIKASEVVELKDIVSKYMVNVVGSLFFGIEVDCFKDPDHEFRKIGETFFDNTSLRNALVNVAFFLCPSLMTKCNIPFLSPKVSKYVRNLLESVVELRRTNSVQRNDFIHQLLQLIDKKPETGFDVQLTLEKCAANVFLFYGASSETSSSTISFCLFEMAKQPEWMRKVRGEIREWMEKYNHEIVYDNLKELTFLNMCVMETLRIYPSVPILNRECTETYRVPNTDWVIEKGTPIVISLMGVHMDPEHYKDPEKFDPYRFKDYKKDFPYYPFGVGPRHCIGEFIT